MTRVSVCDRERGGKQLTAKEAGLPAMSTPPTRTCRAKLALVARPAAALPVTSSALFFGLRRIANASAPTALVLPAASIVIWSVVRASEAGGTSTSLLLLRRVTSHVNCSPLCSTRLLIEPQSSDDSEDIVSANTYTQRNEMDNRKQMLPSRKEQKKASYNQRSQ